MPEGPSWRCLCGALNCHDMVVCWHCGEEREYGLTASEARAVVRKLNEVDELRRQLADPKVAQNAKDWEADHQRRALEHYGLAEEFPYGCDAIEEVAEALLGARQQIGHLKDIMEMGDLDLKRIRGDNERLLSAVAGMLDALEEKADFDEAVTTLDAEFCAAGGHR